MESGSNSGSTFVYLEPLLEETYMCINRNKTYNNDEKVNQYILQNNHTKNQLQLSLQNRLNYFNTTRRERGGEHQDLFRQFPNCPYYGYVCPQFQIEFRYVINLYKSCIQEKK